MSSFFSKSAFALALALGLALLLGSSGPTASVDASPRGVTGGGLDWGVKADFRNYIVTIAGGTITPSGGVTVNGNGTFHFPANPSGSYDGATDDASASFQGSVQFQGHFSIPLDMFLLDLTISDVRLELDGTTGTIVADVVSRDLTTGNFISYPDVDLVTLDLTSNTPTELPASVTWTAIPSALTAPAAPAFEGFYLAGEPFDPVDATLNLEPSGYLTWKVSQNAWTSGSLSTDSSATAPAVKDLVNGFVFPTWTVNYNTVTHVTAINFDGALTLGNTSFGGFHIKLANPSITIDNAGEGMIEADVSYCVSTLACAGGFTVPTLDTTLTTFDYNPAAVTVSGGQYSWTITPDYASVGNQFAQEFIDALDVSLRNFFRNSGAGSDSLKPPAPITITFDTSACGADVDCDGFAEALLSTHTAPANTNAAVDNCLGSYNYAQSNTDGNLVDTSPPYVPATDDITWPMSDAQGNTCDSDDDNDGLSDADEASGAACGGVVTQALLFDTDGDQARDGAECALGTNPTNAASEPLLAACGAVGDIDGDKISNRVEFCYYGTNTAAADSDGDAPGGLDGDGGKDGCEVASINADQIVSSGDQGKLASGISGATVYTAGVDLNKDGLLNSGDQGLMASFISPPGQCP